VALVLVILAMATAAPALADHRVALVIGNSEYRRTAPLANPVHDATAVASALKTLGFEVILGTNLDKRGIDLALQKFARAAQAADSALFYYSGHGMQFRGVNYLMPIDAELEDEISVRYQMTSMDEVRAALNGSSGVKVMILDACRDNPLAEQLARSIAAKTREVAVVHGLSPIEKADGLLVAYSTQPGNIAEDGQGHDSPFTTALLDHIEEPGVEIGTMFRRVSNDVYEQTSGRQVPEVSISLHSDYYLNEQETDLQAWAKARGSNDPVRISDFIRRYPSSFYADDAKLRLDQIERNARQAQAERARAQREAALQAQIVAMEEEQRRTREELEAREKAQRETVGPAATAATLVTASATAGTAPVASEPRRGAQTQPADKTDAPTEMIAAPVPTSPAQGSIAQGPTASVASIKVELRRLGCYAGPIDGDWNSGPTRRAIAELVRQGRLSTVPAGPSPQFFRLLSGLADGLCAPDCGADQVRNANGVCVPRTVARSKAPEQKASVRLHPSVQSQSEDVAVAKKGAGTHCFTLNDRKFCE
jgi:hypothetical protein